MRSYELYVHPSLKVLAEQNRDGALNYLSSFLSYVNLQVVTYEFNRAGELIFGETDHLISYFKWLERRSQGHYDDIPFRAQGRYVPTAFIKHQLKDFKSKNLPVNCHNYAASTFMF